MTPHEQNFRARTLPREAALRAVPREDARWIRPVFRPPPLEVNPFVSEVPYLGTIQRSAASALSPRESAWAR
jgi:hypothetical protein